MKKIGAVVALDKELIPILKKFDCTEVLSGRFPVTKATYKNIELYLIKSGIGEIAAASATQYLIDCYDVSIIVNIGAAGSLRKTVRANDLFIVTDVFHYEFDTSEFDGMPIGKYPDMDGVLIHLNKTFVADAERIGCMTRAICASGNKFLNKPETRNGMAESTGATICDMESAGIALTCAKNNVDVLMIKVVSDSEEEDFNTFIHESMNTLAQVFLPILEEVCL